MYSANCDASRQVGRIVFTSPVLLAGDVELNPGPDRNVAERRRRADRSLQGNGADTKGGITVLKTLLSTYGKRD